MSLPHIVQESVKLWIQALEDAKQGTSVDWPLYNSVLESMKTFVQEDK